VSDARHEQDPCKFKRGKSEQGLERILIKAEDDQHNPDLLNHKFGPDLSLPARLAAVCNAIADRILDFVEPPNNILQDSQLDEYLMSPVSDLADRISRIGPPAMDKSRPFGQKENL